MAATDHVGQAIKRIRLNRDLTISDAAAMAGVVRSTWSLYEQNAFFRGHTSRLKQALGAMNDHSPLTISELEPIAARVDLDEFLGQAPGTSDSQGGTHPASFAPSPYAASAHTLLDALISITGPKAAISTLNKAIADATSSVEPPARKAQPLIREQDSLPSTSA